MDQNIKALVFEHTNQVDLHEFLMLNSPASHYSKTQAYSTHGRAGFTTKSVVEMMLQVDLIDGNKSKR